MVVGGAALALLVVGCGESDPTGGEPTAAVQEAWCWDHPLNPDAILNYGEGPAGGNEVAAISPQPTSAYAHGNCIVGSYAIEVHNVNTATRDFSAFATNYPLPTTPTACENHGAHLEVWEEKLSLQCGASGCSLAYKWFDAGEISLQGKWTPFFGGGYCSMALASGSQAIVFHPNAWRRKVALAVRAWSQPNCPTCATRAKVGVSVFPDPPT